MDCKFDYAFVLTGGIATGKSTVANILKLHGYEVIDADEIAHYVLDELKQEVVDVFGEDILQDNKIDRKKLGNIVFKNHQERVKLENLLHPKIKDEIIKNAKRLEEKKVFYFIDIPLFFEKKNYDIKKTLLIYAPKSVQIQRILKRDKLTKEEALQRISAQMDIEQKRKLANYVIENTKDLKHLTNEIEKFLRSINVNSKI